MPTPVLSPTTSRLATAPAGEATKGSLSRASSIDCRMRQAQPDVARTASAATSAIAGKARERWRKPGWACRMGQGS